MRKLNEKQQKEIQLNILESFVNFCNENHIQYSLGGGTLLGAVRHNGYIPWDDDIDVMMPRKDYEVFLTKYKNNNFEILDYETVKDYYYPFAKIVDKRTKLIEHNYKHIEKMGIYIDVFPIDYLPSNSNKIAKIFSKYKKYDKAITFYRTEGSIKNSTSVLKKILKIITYCYYKNRLICKMYIKKMNNLGLKEKSEYVACISGRYLEKEIMPATYIENYVDASFERLKCKIPSGYDLYLTKHYGNYMELPPKEKQIAGHSNIAYWR